MSHQAAVLDGLARFLDALGVAAYNEDAVYADDVRGIVMGVLPERPTEIVSLSLYAPEFTSLSPTADRRLTATMVQIRYRLVGNPLLGVELFDTLHTAIDRKTLNLGVILATGEYQSFTHLGLSGNGHLFSTNWRLSALQTL